MVAQRLNRLSSSSVPGGGDTSAPAGGRGAATSSGENSQGSPNGRDDQQNEEEKKKAVTRERLMKRRDIRREIMMALKDLPLRDQYEVQQTSAAIATSTAVEDELDHDTLLFASSLLQRVVHTVSDLTQHTDSAGLQDIDVSVMNLTLQGTGNVLSATVLATRRAATPTGGTTPAVTSDTPPSPTPESPAAPSSSVADYTNSSSADTSADDNMDPADTRAIVVNATNTIQQVLQANLRHTVIGESPMTYSTPFFLTSAGRHHTSSIPTVQNQDATFTMPQILDRVIHRQQQEYLADQQLTSTISSQNDTQPSAGDDDADGTQDSSSSESALLSLRLDAECFETYFITYQQSPYIYGEDSNDTIASRVSSLNLHGCQGNELHIRDLDVEEMIDIQLTYQQPQTPPNLLPGAAPTPQESSPQHPPPPVLHKLHRHHMNTHTFSVPPAAVNQTFYVMVTFIHHHQQQQHRPEDTSNTTTTAGGAHVPGEGQGRGRRFPIALLLREEEMPTPNHYLIKKHYRSTQDTLIMHFKPHALNADIQYHLGIVDSTFNSGRGSEHMSDRDMGVWYRDYHVSMWYGECVYWDETQDLWSPHGCTAQPTRGRPVAQQLNVLHCRCDHLTAFGAQFSLVPNDLHLTDVTVFFDLQENVVCLVVIGVTLLVYCILLVVMIRLDRRAATKDPLIHLIDNRPGDPQVYVITVQTGARHNAGTTAKVSIMLYGEYGRSETRELCNSGDNSELFDRNATDTFYMTYSDSLGKITRIHLWHNNAGTSPSWYLSRVVVRDVNMNKEFYFDCEDWLSVESRNGKVDQEITSTKQTHGFYQILYSAGSDYLLDYHIWLSTVCSSTASRFTRVQRLTCCLCLWCSYMCVSAAWYNIQTPEGRSEFAFIDLSWRSLVVGIITSVLILPYNFLIIMLFRKAKSNKCSSCFWRLRCKHKHDGAGGKDGGDYFTTGGGRREGEQDDSSLFDQFAFEWQGLQSWAQKVWTKREDQTATTGKDVLAPHNGTAIEQVKQLPQTNAKDLREDGCDNQHSMQNTNNNNTAEQDESANNSYDEAVDENSESDDHTNVEVKPKADEEVQDEEHSDKQHSAVACNQIIVGILKEPKRTIANQNSEASTDGYNTDDVRAAPNNEPIRHSGVTKRRSHSARASQSSNHDSDSLGCASSRSGSSVGFHLYPIDCSDGGNGGGNNAGRGDSDALSSAPCDGDDVGDEDMGISSGDSIGRPTPPSSILPSVLVTKHPPLSSSSSQHHQTSQSGSDITCATFRSAQHALAVTRQQLSHRLYHVRLLPWWCRYIAWVLCVATIVLCTTVTAMYGYRFGRSRSLQWLQSLLFSMLQCAFVTHPVIVLVLALWAAVHYRGTLYLYKSCVHTDSMVDTCTHSTAVHHRGTAVYPSTAGEEQHHLTTAQRLAARQRSRYLRYKLQPLQKKEIKKSRRYFRTIHAMSTLLSETTRVLMLCGVLVIIAFSHNTTQYQYELNTSIAQVLLATPTYEGPGGTGTAAGTTGYRDISSIDDWWQWTRGHLIPMLYQDQDLHDAWNEGHHKLRIGNSYVVGAVSLRQLRIATEPHAPMTATCGSIMRYTTNHPATTVVCKPPYADHRADHQPHSGSSGQSYRDVPNYNNTSSAVPSAYDEDDDLEHPVWWYSDVTRARDFIGVHGMYGGGGYQVLLPHTYHQGARMVDNMYHHGWLDDDTRMVAIELTLFHPPTSMFSSVRLVTEFTAFSSAHPTHTCVSTQLYNYLHVGDTFLLVAEMCFILLTAVHIKRQAAMVIQHKTAYVKDVWNVIQVSVCVLSVTYIVCVIYRFVLISDTIALLRRTHYEEYVDISHLHHWQLVLHSMLGFLLLLVYIQCIRIFRYTNIITHVIKVYRLALPDFVAIFAICMIWVAAYTSVGVTVYQAVSSDMIGVDTSFAYLFNLLIGHYGRDEHILNDSIGWRILVVTFFVLGHGFTLAYCIATLVYHYNQAKPNNRCSNIRMRSAIKEYASHIIDKLGLKHRHVDDEDQNYLPPEYLMAEIEYQVDEMLFKTTALCKGATNLPEKPPVYYTDSDGTYGAGGVYVGAPPYHEGPPVYANHDEDAGGFDEQRLTERISKIEHNLVGNNLQLEQLIRAGSVPASVEKTLTEQLVQECMHQLQQDRHQRSRRRSAVPKRQVSTSSSNASAKHGGASHHLTSKPPHHGGARPKTRDTTTTAAPPPHRLHHARHHSTGSTNSTSSHSSGPVPHSSSHSSGTASGYTSPASAGSDSSPAQQPKLSLLRAHQDVSSSSKPDDSARSSRFSSASVGGEAELKAMLTKAVLSELKFGKPKLYGVEREEQQTAPKYTPHRPPTFRSRRYETPHDELTANKNFQDIEKLTKEISQSLTDYIESTQSHRSSPSSVQSQRSNTTDASRVTPSFGMSSLQHSDSCRSERRPRTKITLHKTRSQGKGKGRVKDMQIDQVDIETDEEEEVEMDDETQQ